MMVFLLFVFMQSRRWINALYGMNSNACTIPGISSIITDLGFLLNKAAVMPGISDKYGGGESDFCGHLMAKGISNGCSIPKQACAPRF
ncbi:hypothetical protein NFX39_03640 [Fructobacillus sp. W13]|uniref:Uncharacterized protein n=1 Tax=Fructobacillus apis TaxID=2935017 RepID=A0ABT0ZQA8_9LACO|nr:hypothetical protein [Fructobacillus apis]MCO0832181.1 hypothetical protein [Fructobacillus apis]